MLPTLGKEAPAQDNFKPTNSKISGIRNRLQPELREGYRAAGALEAWMRARASSKASSAAG